MSIPPHDKENSELPRTTRDLGRPDSFASSQPSRDDEPVKHVPVRDASGYPKNEAPLSAYMVSPRYLPRDKRSDLPPKRPLGARPQPQTSTVRQPQTAARPRRPREPVFYSEAATFGMADRIRRPRMQTPVEPAVPITVKEEDDKVSGRDKIAAYIAAGTAVIAGTLVLIRNSLLDGGAYVVRKFRSIGGSPSSLSYTAASGVQYRRFGISGEWWRVGLPVVVVIILAIGILGNLYNGANNGSGNSGGTSGGNGGNATMQVTPTAAAGPNNKGATQKGGNNAAATSGNSPASGGNTSTTAPGAATGSSNATNTFSGLTGGRGGGSPTISTGSNSTSQAAPAPVGSSGGTSGGSTGSSTGSGSTGSTGSSGSDGGSGGSGGSGSTLPVTTGTPLPVTVTVPSTDTTLDGKGVESTTPIGATLN